MKVLLYDNTENKFVGWSWKIGARIYKVLGIFDKVVPVHDWEEAIDSLVKIYINDPDCRYMNVQFWGHGSPGQARINRKALKLEHLDGIAPGMFAGTNSLFWFRCCSTFRGEKGHQFAKDVCTKLGCQVSGHTYIIGFPFHSGLHSLKPGQTPEWQLMEGEKASGGSKMSMFGEPNTIWTWKNKIPEGW